MKIENKIKIAVLALTVLMVGVIIPREAQAWGPERDLYTNESPADHAVFNSIMYNAAVGDERDFVRIVKIPKAGEEKGDYENEVNVKGGEEYEVYIYYHNNASATYNDEAHNYVGVARNVRLATQFPTKILKGEKGTVSGTISATNTNPLKVWDEAYMNASEDVTLAYKVGSAKIYNDHATNGSVLPESLFSAEGTFLGFDSLNGVLLGCDEYSGQVVYTIVATAVNPPAPTPVEPDPNVPEVLPDTGPAEIVLASIVIVVMAAVVAYFIYSSSMLNKTEKKVMGKRKK